MTRCNTYVELHLHYVLVSRTYRFCSPKVNLHPIAPRKQRISLLVFIQSIRNWRWYKCWTNMSFRSCTWVSGEFIWNVWRQGWDKVCYCEKVFLPEIERLQLIIANISVSADMNLRFLYLFVFIRPVQYSLLVGIIKKMDKKKTCAYYKLRCLGNEYPSIAIGIFRPPADQSGKLLSTCLL